MTEYKVCVVLNVYIIFMVHCICIFFNSELSKDVVVPKSSSEVITELLYIHAFSNGLILL